MVNELGVIPSKIQTTPYIDVDPLVPKIQIERFADRHRHRSGAARAGYRVDALVAVSIAPTAGSFPYLLLIAGRNAVR
jgi:hypothetical protein